MSSSGGLLRAATARDTFIAWTFVLVQLVLLAAVLLLPAGTAWALDPPVDFAARLAQWIGLAVLVLGLVGLGRSLTPLPTPVPHGALRTGGIYGYVRHPIYTGILLLAGGAALRSGSWWVVGAAVALGLWFSLKARWEEEQLRGRYPDYDRYAATTPRFLPRRPCRAVDGTCGLAEGPSGPEPGQASGPRPGPGPRGA